MSDPTATAATDDLADAKAQLAALMIVRAAVIRAVEVGFPASQIRAMVGRALFDVCDDPDA